MLLALHAPAAVSGRCASACGLRRQPVQQPTFLSCKRERLHKGSRLAAGGPDEVPSTAPLAEDKPAPQPAAAAPAADAVSSKPKRKREAETTDAIASFLTRRFGIAGGLAWLAFLTIGSLGEQVKTRIEYANEQAGTKDVEDAKEVTTASGLKYTDLRVGGGQSPPKGYLVLVDYVGKVDGVVFEDTRARGKPIVYVFGGRPFTAGLCAGVEEAISTMKAGGRRRVVVPPQLGFGDRGAVLRPTEHVPEKQGVIPPGATLEYDIELLRVSIPPS